MTGTVPSPRKRRYPTPLMLDTSPVGDEVDVRRMANYHLCQHIDDGIDPDPLTDEDILRLGYTDWEVVGVDETRTPGRAVLRHHTHRDLWLVIHSVFKQRLLPGRDWSAGISFRFLHADTDYGNDLKLGTPDELIGYALTQHHDRMWSADATVWVLAALPGERARTEAFLLSLHGDRRP